MKFTISHPYTPIFSLEGITKLKKGWQFTDHKGHVHTKEEDLGIIPAEYENYYEWDEYTLDYCGQNEISPKHYYCEKCFEIIFPEFYQDMVPFYQYGRKEFYIDDIPVSEEEYRRIYEEQTRTF